MSSEKSTGVHIEEALINTSSDGVAYLVLSNPNGVSCQVDVNACIGVVHEVSLVDPGTEPHLRSWGALLLAEWRLLGTTTKLDGGSRSYWPP